MEPDVKRVLDIPACGRKPQVGACAGPDPCSRILDAYGGERCVRVVDLQLLTFTVT